MKSNRTTESNCRELLNEINCLIEDLAQNSTKALIIQRKLNQLYQEMTKAEKRNESNY